MSKKLKLSPWHSGDVKPVHVGVYERTFNHENDKSRMYCKWNGKFWCVIGFIVKDAYILNDESCFQLQSKNKWRGILK